MEEYIRKEIKKSIDTIIDLTKDYNTLGHLWSSDIAVKNIAALHKNVHALKARLNLDDVKSVRIDHGAGPSLIRCNDEVTLVQVRPCENDKTYVGIYIGDMAVGADMQVVDNELVISPSYRNPVIYVPQLNKLVFGYESWWSPIDKDSIDSIGISDDDINNTWYVQLLKGLEKNEQNKI